MACSFNVYTSDGCALFPKIPVKPEDKAILKAQGFSDQFILGIANHNEIHDAVCNKNKTFELLK